ncbi:hypothetical protein MiSe_50570 [Microseira wollei NIES-4236]|uniref:Uncharacterized protein n=1 Tax=Microseira wollei NIES-4236 TaxID=2530354 RepID=A0AAV3XDC8_9CYAN|nr:hypothetical protein MiSe_50570 [Microseira wollei NIES-4236]
MPATVPTILTELMGGERSHERSEPRRRDSEAKRFLRFRARRRRRRRERSLFNLNRSRRDIPQRRKRRERRESDRALIYSGLQLYEVQLVWLICQSLGVGTRHLQYCLQGHCIVDAVSLQAMYLTRLKSPINRRCRQINAIPIVN